MGNSYYSVVPKILEKLHVIFLRSLVLVGVQGQSIKTLSLVGVYTFASTFDNA